MPQAGNDMGRPSGWRRAMNLKRYPLVVNCRQDEWRYRWLERVRTSWGPAVSWWSPTGPWDCSSTCFRRPSPAAIQPSLSIRLEPRGRRESARQSATDVHREMAPSGLAASEFRPNRRVGQSVRRYAALKAVKNSTPCGVEKSPRNASTVNGRKLVNDEIATVPLVEPRLECRLGSLLFG